MHNLSCENEFYLHENEKSFSYQRLSTYTEARGNSEIAYYVYGITDNKAQLMHDQPIMTIMKFERSELVYQQPVTHGFNYKLFNQNT